MVQRSFLDSAGAVVERVPRPVPVLVGSSPPRVLMVVGTRRNRLVVSWDREFCKRCVQKARDRARGKGKEDRGRVVMVQQFVGIHTGDYRGATTCNVLTNRSFEGWNRVRGPVFSVLSIVSLSFFCSFHNIALS